MNASAILSLAAIVLASCQLPARQAVNVPVPYVDNGVLVDVHGLYKRGRHVVGVSGLATNQSDKDLSLCTLTFELMDADGNKVSDALASTSSLRSGATWKFQAVITSAFGTKFNSITPGRVTVLAAQ